jgi:fission 1 protein
MAAIMLDDCISDEELELYRQKFQRAPLIDSNTKFQYALCLVRSKNQNNIKTGLNMFKNLFDDTKDEDVKRDALYYMAIAEAKMKNYEPAIKYLKTILSVQTNNEQVKDLYVEINNRMKKDGLIGLGIVGGAAAVGLVGLIGLGAALLSKK